MVSSESNPTGLTRETGWQIGLRRTLPIPAPVLWDWMLSAEGLAVWLGDVTDFQMESGKDYQLEDGTVGQIRVFQPGSHWRMTRLPPDDLYPRASVMQIRILDVEDKSTLVFHEEHLPSQQERLSRKEFYLLVIEKINQRLIPD